MPWRPMLAVVGVFSVVTAIVFGLARAEPFLMIFWYFVLLYSIYSISWNIAGGLTNLFSLGHAMFFGTSAMAFAHLVRFTGNPMLSIALAALAGSVLVVPLIPALRLRGPFFMLSTYALSVAVYFVTLNTDWFSGGGSGIVLRIDPAYTREVVVLIALVILSIASITFVRLKRSYLGMAMMAIRDDEEAAESLGIPVSKVKLVSLVLSALFAGLAGALHALWLSYVHVDAFNSTSVSLLGPVITLLGGKALLVGSLIGGLTNAVIYFYFTAGLGEATLLFYGALLALVLLVEPDGLASTLRRLTRSEIFSI
ncbi:MAG: branched-chain amino acid ABC transporter permease [Nitrososphaerota archaeon]